MYDIFVLNKQNTMFSSITLFKIIAYLEGLSYILLLFIATPIKWFLKDPQYVKLLGLPHGILFIIYIILAFKLKNDFNWNKALFKKVIFASIIPFGSFFIKKQITTTSIK